MDDGLRMVQARACSAWSLPGDPTCAGIARRVFRRVAEGLALDPEAVDDGVTMVSELAANTLHAQQRQAVAANPELWLYLRGTGPVVELVCKVFDTLPGWVHGNVPGRAARRAPADAISGRGLEVVHELSGGSWGHHLSRARLSGAAAGLRGKAVWFALPLPAPVAATTRRPGGPAVAGSVVMSGAAARPFGPAAANAGAAMTELEKDLGGRGFADAMVRADDPSADMAVLSISSGLTVWCRAAAAWLRAPGITVQQWSYCDLTEVAEQAVQAHETIAAISDPFRRLADTGGEPAVHVEHEGPELVDVDGGRHARVRRH